MSIIKRLSHQYCERDRIHLGDIVVSGMDQIGSDPEFFTGKVNIAKTLNIKLVEITKDRDDKINFVSWLFGRKIESTKDLYIGEALAVINASESLRLAYASYARKKFYEQTT